MRRYQLSGLEHIHMIRHVPRSYDMTRTHILQKSVNKHVDVVLRCSPKNWKKKKVTVSVVKGEKKNNAARIRASAKKGYIAVRKIANEQYEADRRAAAAAYEINYSADFANSDMLIHDMKSQIAAMARKSADYIDDQLTAKTADSISEPVTQNAENNVTPVETEKPLISAETEDILKKGGYRLPPSKPPADNPYATDYLLNASNEEFHNLMNSLERSLDEACRKYAIEPIEPTVNIPPETETVEESGEKSAFETGNNYFGYSGSYTLPGDSSLSVNNINKKQGIKTEEPEVKTEESHEEEFKPALTFTAGGEHYLPEDDLFDRQLNRPGERYVPPAYFFDDDDVSQDSDETDSSAYVPLPDPIPLPVSEEPEKQAIFYTEETDQPIDRSEGYPREDYTQQRIPLPTQPDGTSSVPLYNQPDENGDYALPTLFHDYSSGYEDQQEDDGYDIPMSFPYTDDSDGKQELFGYTDGNSEPPVPFPDQGNSDGKQELFGYTDEDSEPPVPFPDQGNSDGKQELFNYTDEDSEPPMIFPDDDEEDLPPPMIFPDSDEEEGYSPAPVSPDRNEYYGGDQETKGVIDRSGETMFSRTGDQIKKVIGVIRGSSDSNVRSDNGRGAVDNRNVDITFSDRDS